jgi:hypothetical protein
MATTRAIHLDIADAMYCSIFASGFITICCYHLKALGGSGYGPPNGHQPPPNEYHREKSSLGSIIIFLNLKKR